MPQALTHESSTLLLVTLRSGFWGFGLLVLSIPLAFGGFGLLVFS